METLENNMFCTYCAAGNPVYAKFCFSCGRELLPAMVPLPQPTTNTAPPYAKFVLQVVCGLFLFSAGVVGGLQLELLNVHDAKLIRPLALAGVAVWQLLVAKRSWKTISNESSSDAVLAKKHNRTVRAAVFLGLFFLICSSLIGWLVGKSRFQLQTLDADLSEYAKLGDDVSRGRNNVGKTIEDFIAMYEVIETDTNALQTNTTRLLGELTQYDNDFPEYHTQTQKSLHNVSITQRRTFLLQKQIAVAKELKSSDPAVRGVLWTGKMMPLLQQEDKLDSQ